VTTPNDPPWPPNPPPARPAGYTDQNWADYVQTVGGAQRGGPGQLGNVSYYPSANYHFSLGSQWLNDGTISQPHITINDTQTHVYINAHNTNPSRLAGNAASRQIFVNNGIANPDALLSTFCTALVAKQTSFQLFSVYREDLKKHRQRYPWPTVLRLWTDHAKVAAGCLIERTQYGESIVVAPRNAPGPLSVLKLSSLKGTLPQPASPDFVAYLNSDYRVICLANGQIQYVMSSMLGKQPAAKSDQAVLLAKMNQANDIAAIAPTEITTFLTTNPILGQHSGAMLVFWIDDKCREAEIGPQGALDRNSFTSMVLAHLDANAKFLPEVALAPAALQQRAKEAVEAVGKGSYVVSAGADAWVVPKLTAVRKLDPTAEDLRVGLPVYTIIGPYSPRGTNTGGQILNLGAKYWTVPKGHQWTKPASRSEGIVIMTGSAQQGPYAFSDTLRVFDFDRYTWFNGLPLATTESCGSVQLIKLPLGTDYIIIGKREQYLKQGSYFAETGTADCLCFTHPENNQLSIVDPAKSIKIKTARASYSLNGNGGYIMTNTKNEFVLCPGAPVTADLAAPTPGTVIVEFGGALVGLADADTLELLDLATLVTAGNLADQVTVSALTSYFVSTDPATGAVRRYSLRGYLPAKPTDPDADKILAEITANPGTLTAAAGTGEYADWPMVVQDDGPVPLTAAVLLGQLPSGVSIVAKGNADPTWQTTIAVTLVADFSEQCDLLVADAGGAFAGYANSKSAPDAYSAISELVQQWPGTHQRAPAYPFDGTDPQADGLAVIDIIVADGTPVTSPFFANIIRTGLSPAECLTLLGANALFWADSSTGEWILCTPAAEPDTALVPPPDWSFTDVMAWLHPEDEGPVDESGYEADDEKDDGGDGGGDGGGYQADGEGYGTESGYESDGGQTDYDTADDGDGGQTDYDTADETEFDMVSEDEGVV
jgi:hypothetical protein